MQLSEATRELGLQSNMPTGLVGMTDEDDDNDNSTKGSAAFRLCYLVLSNLVDGQKTTFKQKFNRAHIGNLTTKQIDGIFDLALRNRRDDPTFVYPFAYEFIPILFETPTKPKNLLTRFILRFRPDKQWNYLLGKMKNALNSLSEKQVRQLKRKMTAAQIP